MKQLQKLIDSGTNFLKYGTPFIEKINWLIVLSMVALCLVLALSPWILPFVEDIVRVCRGVK